MTRRLFIAALALLATLALPAAAQSSPNANYTDMWWLPAESGWGLSITQHTDTNRVYAVWYTYDPRAPDPATTSNYKPIWFVMNGGTWTSPTTLTGNVFVTNGTPYYQGWSAGAFQITQVGSFTFNFSDTSNGTFTYNISPPGGLAPSDPAYGLPSISGTKSIGRQSF